MRRALARFGRLAQALAALLLLAQAAQAAQPGCSVREAAGVTLDVEEDTILVHPQLNGMPTTFVLDTGAQRTVLTEAAARRVDVARDEWIGTTMQGIGGVDRRPNADPRSFTLGGVALVRPILSRDTSLVVGVLGRTRVGGQVIDGVLGRDFLSAFDLDLDVPQRRLTLYHVSGCAGRFLPWPGKYASIPVMMPVNAGIFVAAAVDGVGLTALLDSGANASMLTEPGVRRLALEDRQLGGGRPVLAGGLGRRLVPTYPHTFHSLRVGDRTEDDPVIWVSGVRLAPITDMLLGADWLSGQRVWISFATRQLFVAAPDMGG